VYRREHLWGHPPIAARELGTLPGMVEPLKLHGVGKRYGPRSPWVLRGVDLELSPGSVTKIDGANGSGKSTLLALLAGISRPSRGRVIGGGRRAYVPERLPAVLPYDVSGYLDRLGAAHGLPADDARRRAAYWLDRLGASQWAHAPMAALSTGTAQKVALAQALMADADWLVLDEPWTGLDAQARDVLDDALRERIAAGAGIVYVGHQHTRHADAAADNYVIRAGSLVRISRQPVPAFPSLPPTLVPPSSTSTTAADLVEIEFDDGIRRQSIQVTSATSDDALRRLLAEPRHHVRSVRPIAQLN
jgi:ABC-type Mn2+/Zn2+ transport system ATPase subunit